MAEKRSSATEIQDPDQEAAQRISVSRCGASWSANGYYELELNVSLPSVHSVSFPQSQVPMGCSSSGCSRRRSVGMEEDSQVEVIYSQIPASISQRHAPVIRFFRPPEMPWMVAKCRELNIPEVIRLPVYGHRKQFDGLRSRPCWILPIIPDGHCGFRAISVMLTGGQRYFYIIRTAVAEFVVHHASEDWLSPHLPTPFDAASYFDRMSCAVQLSGGRNYCTNVELMAAAVLFKMDILCYDADRGKWQLYAHDKSYDQTDDVPTLLLELYQEHFNVVTDVEAFH